MIDPRELLRIHVDTLFTRDDRGRLVNVNEPNGKPAPRFLLGRTARGNQCWFRHDVTDDLLQELTALCEHEPVGEVFAPDADSVHFQEVLARTAPIQNVWTGPAYCFPRELGDNAETVRITSANRELLLPCFLDWLNDVEHAQPFMALVSEEQAVSVCASVRIGGRAHEAGVETHPAFRGRGYAAPTVAAWAGAVREHDRIPLYSTSWLNTASQSVARTLQLICYAATLHIT